MRFLPPPGLRFRAGSVMPLIVLPLRIRRNRKGRNPEGQLVPQPPCQSRERGSRRMGPIANASM
jgi:hypothetical protein